MNAAFVIGFGAVCAQEQGSNLNITCHARTQHVNLHVELSGFHIHPSFPHLGALPDGIVQCSCCGKGVLEIKCPYNAREYLISDAIQENFIDFLDTTPHEFALKHLHSYFYQIQTQLFICEYVC